MGTGGKYVNELTNPHCFYSSEFKVFNLAKEREFRNFELCLKKLKRF